MTGIRGRFSLRAIFSPVYAAREIISAFPIVQLGPIKSLWRNYAMADQIQIMGKKAKRGDRMTKGKGWRLAVIKGDKRIFVGTLLETINMGNKRLAIFSVPK